MAGTHVPNSPVNWNLKHYSRGRLTWFLSQILTTRPPNDDKFGKNNGIPRTQTPSRTHTVNACIWVAKEAIFSLFLLNLTCITPTFPRLLARTRITSIQSHCKVVTVTWKWQLIHRDKNSDIWSFFLTHTGHKSNKCNGYGIYIVQYASFTAKQCLLHVYHRLKLTLRLLPRLLGRFNHGINKIWFNSWHYNPITKCKTPSIWPWWPMANGLDQSWLIEHLRN